MMLTRETSYSKASDKSILVERIFDAPLEMVWRYWTEHELIDQWWAPKPWQARTKTQDFKEGGRWLYYMEGPDGSKQYCKVDYKSIVANKSFSGWDGFCDENGVTQPEPPGMDWQVAFAAEGDTTKVNVTITFASAADLEKIVEMGFKEGFAAAHTNLDELLAKK